MNTKDRLGEQRVTVTMSSTNIDIMKLLMESGMAKALQKAKEHNAPFDEVLTMTVAYARILGEINNAQQAVALQYSNSKLEEIRCKSN